MAGVSTVEPRFPSTMKPACTGLTDCRWIACCTEVDGLLGFGNWSPPQTDEDFDAGLHEQQAAGL